MAGTGIDYAGCDCRDGPDGKTEHSLWNLQCRIWLVLVFGQCVNGDSLRCLGSVSHYIFSCDAACLLALFSFDREEAQVSLMRREASI